MLGVSKHAWRKEQKILTLIDFTEKLLIFDYLLFPPGQLSENGAEAGNPPC